jgi:signal transduction histidine kinase/PAS domain-containing protein
MQMPTHKSREKPTASIHQQNATIEDHTQFQKNGRRLYFAGWFPSRTLAARFLPPPWNHPFPGFLIAALSQVGIFALLRLALIQWPDIRFTGFLPLVTVLLVTCGWGMFPAILATICGALLFVFFPISTRTPFSLAVPIDVISLLIYICIGCFMSWIVEQLVRARLKAETISNQFEATFEAISDSISIYDQAGKILRINKAGRDTFAMQVQENYLHGSLLERISLLQLRDEQGKLLTPEQWPQSRMLRGEVLNGTRAVVHALDDREVYLAISGAPIRDEKGKIHGAVCISRDETERHMLEQRTHKALEALLRMTEELIELPTQELEAVTLTDRQRDIQSHNIAQRLVELIRSILGCERVSITTVDSQTQALVSTAIVGVSPEQEQLWRARKPHFNLHDQLVSESTYERLQANEMLILDLRQRQWENNINPFGITTLLLVPMNIGGNLIGVLALDHGGLVHTYTQEEQQLAKAVAEMAALVLERERLFQERAKARASEISLRETNRLMDDFIGIASHELRTPLTTTKASVQLAQRNLNRLTQGQQESYTQTDLIQQLQPTRQLLERAEQQISLQNRLIHELLDVSRIERNKLELRLEQVDLARLIRDLIENQLLLEPGRNLFVESCNPGAVFVQADADRLEQVITNLLSNALKYSEPDTAVAVSLEVREDNVQVRIHDHGPGLPLEIQQRIWERFYRVPGIETRSGSGIGLGLGLHISRTLIELHGGQIGVESAPGEGSTFWFTLPLAKTLSNNGGNLN